MNFKNFDERQTLNRYKIGFQSFFLTLFLLLISGMIQEAGLNFASPWINASTIIFISLMFFTIRVILCDAFYSSSNYLSMTVLMIIFSILAAYEIHSIFLQVLNQNFIIFNNHRLSDDFFQFIYTVYLISSSVTYWIKRLCEKFC